MKLVKKWTLLSLLLLVFLPTQAAQDYKFHSIFFYNFAKYTQWPTNYRSGDFVIGILGDSKIKQPLEDMARQRTLPNQRIVVKTFNSVSDITWSHIIFVPFDKSGQLDEVLAQTEGKPTMVVTEKPGLGHQGSTINFILVNGSWQFELNRSALEASDLKVSGELTRLAIQI